MYKRLYFNGLMSRLNEPRRFIQSILGPRQSGKTFLIKQIINEMEMPTHYVLADEPSVRDHVWIEQQWEIGRLKTREFGKAILIFDEIQKIEGWSETIKYLWDTDASNNIDLRVVLLGSSPLLVQKGLTESLAGRFEIVFLPHWSFAEMRDAFGWNIDKYIYYGGYPGAASLIEDNERWRSYVNESLIETSISKDILFMKRIDKPALLKRLFHLGCEYSGQILSYQKMLGQLKDAGNTVTLAGYLDLLANAWMLCGLSKFAVQGIRRKGSSPKFQVFNNALMSAVSNISFEDAIKNRDYWGRLVESAIGSHLVNSFSGKIDCIFYWREGSDEVDFVIQKGEKILVIEVKSGRKKGSLPGMAAFAKHFKSPQQLLVGGDGIPIEEFLSRRIEDFIL